MFKFIVGGVNTKRSREGPTPAPEHNRPVNDKNYKLKRLNARRTSEQPRNAKTTSPLSCISKKRQKTTAKRVRQSNEGRNKNGNKTRDKKQYGGLFLIIEYRHKSMHVAAGPPRTAQAHAGSRMRCERSSSNSGAHSVAINL